MPQVFDSLAVRLDGPRAWDHHLTICWEFTDDGAMYVTELRNGALNHRTAGTPPAGCTTFRLTRPALVGLVTGRLDLTAALGDGTVEVAGDAADLGRLVSLLAPVDPDFAIVTPRGRSRGVDQHCQTASTAGARRPEPSGSSRAAPTRNASAPTAVAAFTHVSSITSPVLGST